MEDKEHPNKFVGVQPYTPHLFEGRVGVGTVCMATDGAAS